MKQIRFFSLLLLCLLLPATASAAETAPPIGGGLDTWLTSLEAAREKAAADEKLIIVDLYAEWCGWCKTMDEEVFSTPEFLDWAEKDYVLLRVDTEDGAEGARLAQRFRASSLPTTLVISPDLVRVGKIRGYHPTKVLIEKIGGHVKAFDGLIQAYESFGESTDRDPLTSLARELHDRADGPRATVLYRRMLGLGEMPGEEKARLHYLLADSLRLAGEFAQAATELDRAESLAGENADADFVESWNLLRIRIAQDQGDCKETVTALQSFLAAHPQSRFRKRAQNTLNSLDATCS